MMKKILSIIMTICMLLTLVAVPVNVFATEADDAAYEKSTLGGYYKFTFTEGDVYITLDLLKRMMVGANVVIFINQGFVGMNKWLISKYKEMTNSDMVILDTGINYNKYIDKGYRVVPIGEDAIINQVLEDFYG
jgi:hypothetical protein